MSHIATQYAWAAHIKPASQKLLLLALAERADEQMFCYPSYSRLAKDTGLNRKTVESNFNDMVAKGFLLDTGHRKGRTKGIKVVQIIFDNMTFNNDAFQQKSGAPGAHNGATKTPNMSIKSTQTGTQSNPDNGIALGESNPDSGVTCENKLPQFYHEATPILPSNNPNNGVACENKPPQFYHEATPILPPSDPDFTMKPPQFRGTEPIKEPIKEPVKEPYPQTPIEHGEKKSVNGENAVLVVFDFWKQRMGKPTAQLDGKRKALIKSAIAMGYTVENICQAVDGCAKTPFNMGQNDRGQRFDSLQTILKDGDQVDRFMENSVNPPVAKRNGTTENNAFGDNL